MKTRLSDLLHMTAPYWFVCPVNADASQLDIALQESLIELQSDTTAHARFKCWGQQELWMNQDVNKECMLKCFEYMVLIKLEKFVYFRGIEVRNGCGKRGVENLKLTRRGYKSVKYIEGGYHQEKLRNTASEYHVRAFSFLHSFIFSLLIFFLFLVFAFCFFLRRWKSVCVAYCSL